MKNLQDSPMYFRRTSKLLFILLYFLTASLPGLAEEWIDVTDVYVKNPRYDGNYLGDWDGTALTAANPHENAEHYQRDFDTYQRLTGLRPGTYRLSLDAFYRMGNSANDFSRYNSGNYADYQKASLYATSAVGDYATPIVPASSAALPYSLGGYATQLGTARTGYYYIPNNMEAAYCWFEAGYYDNSLECEVGDDGELTIGIRKSMTLNEDWICIDNWQLEYWGELVEVETIELSDYKLTLMLGEDYQLDATVQPEDATYQKVNWYSGDEEVVRVDADGTLHAVGEGTVSVFACDKDWSEMAECIVTVYRNVPTSESLIINEIMSSNVDVYLDPSLNYGSWVELYNPTDQAVTLGGLYVSDDPANLKKNRLLDSYGTIPAHGFALLNFDHHEPYKAISYRQINDKLNPEGGVIIVSDGVNIIAQQTYPQVVSRASYARTSDGGTTWGVTATPTPGSSNQGSSFATVQLAAPVVNQPGQLFSGSLNVQVTIPTGTALYYTTDGSTPTIQNGSRSMTGRFTVSATTCYRFRLYQTGKLPSPVVTRSYIKNSGNEPFPVISIVTDDAHIFGSDYGVFVQSENGRPGNGQTASCNWNMDWDRPVNFEYITTEGECVINQECDFSACGGWSRAFTPHSFKLKANKVYDLQNSFDYQFFPDKPFLRHKTLQIRNGGNDTSCRIKDGAIQGVVEASGINVDYQSWKPVHVFFNGSPYAVLNMREPNNKHFVKANYGLDSEEIDQFEICPDSCYVQMEGTDEAFLRWYELAKNAADPQAYAEICQLVDMDEYLNYMAIELYLGNTDWPKNNIKGFRSKADGKFRFVLFDLDHALSTTNSFNEFAAKQTYYFDTLHGFDYSNNENIEGKHLTLEIKLVTIFLNMLKNETFKKRFADTFCLVAGSVFTPELTRQIINERAAHLAQGGYVNPYSTANSLVSGFASRQSTMVNNMQSYLGLSSGKKLTASLSSNVSDAQLLVNNQEIPTGQFNGTLFAPVTLKAVAPAGYKFAGWRNESGSVATERDIFAKGSSWSYYDQGSLDGESWTATSYSTSGWQSGSTPIGYDYNNQHPEIVTTTEGWRPTYYFRKTITLPSVSKDDQYVLNWVADDGFIVYVNGTEAGRYNMPSGSVSYSTYASTYAYNNPESGTMQLPASLFRQGTNVIAVQLHNNSATSTDIYWNAALSAVTYVQGDDYISTSPEYTLPQTGTVTLQAVWEPLPDSDCLAAGATPVKVNEVSAGNSVYVNEYFKHDDWLELYNASDQTVDVAGMFLSDDDDTPQKFQIPATDEVNTILEPGGHLVVWASKRASVSQLNAPFKLAMGADETVLLTSEDGSWADTLIYTWHGGTQSVGLYPDGGTQVYVMDLPSIGKKNTYTSYAKWLSAKPYGTGEAASTFTLHLAEGWNWISHPLSDALPLSTVSANALQFVGQRKQALCDPQLGWVGALSSLDPTEGYKVKMQADMSYTYDGPFCAASATAISLRPGWNWIGYPLTESQTVSAALQQLSAAEGDVLVGRTGVATFEQGRWSGSLQVLQPGAAYLYKSSVAQSFRFSTAAASAHQAKARFLPQPRTSWTANMSTYPNVMSIIAKVTADGTETTDYSIGAFTADGECRGVGTYVDGLLYLTIYGDGLENIFLQAANPQTGLVSRVNESFFFTADVLGSRIQPLTISLGEVTGIASVKYASALQSVTYYTLQGGLAVAPDRAALPTGIYIAKYRLADGTTLTKKIAIK